MCTEPSQINSKQIETALGTLLTLAQTSTKMFITSRAKNQFARILFVHKKKSFQ